MAVAQALRYAGHAQVQLKWPNDLVVGDRKLGGLLVEGGGEHAGPVCAVIGLGLNVRMPEAAASGIDQPWIDLASLESSPSRNLLAAAVLEHLLPALDRFDAEGLAPFQQPYEQLDALHGREVAVQLGDQAQSGRALGIAADGALRVEVDGMERLFHSGEVSVRRQ